MASRFGLPFVPVVERVRATEPQELMANSAQQYGNVADAFAIKGDVPSGLVFLIDDIVDSRWTLTVVGQLLRRERQRTRRAARARPADLTISSCHFVHRISEP